ncbi:hypothetical protein PAXRUDRAFT_173491 [Paxillus rubicundulus Ve08.2h10]|uniref:DDE Tnp4 domain-containing protein n=1 Tax=Paxillus rubicundulus Ve08.2h10 TaxID=930991 RepID=A0A0D0CJ28_9AGAM|nr:hypothetical protein PAXRUDRAFT_173491 [Paxillus rubicundulus Ve08.2h10]
MSPSCTLIFFTDRIRPEKDTEENTTYNYYVSKVCICSEHAIGYLKGTWQSLRGLCVRLDSEDHIQYATLCIITCIHLHSFALGHQTGINISSDHFFQKGLQIMAEEQERNAEWVAIREQQANEEERARDEARNVELLRGRIKREEMKLSLFRYLYNQE